MDHLWRTINNRDRPMVLDRPRLLRNSPAAFSVMGLFDGNNRVGTAGWRDRGGGGLPILRVRRRGLKITNKAQSGFVRGDRVTTFHQPFLWLPLPGSPADMTATVFFLGLVGLIAWQIYHSSAK